MWRRGSSAGTSSRRPCSSSGKRSSEPMTMYGELIRGYAESYDPGCWGIIYTADVRMRREHMEDPPASQA
eukprot:6734283-Alexandrium_andersonii.AAC.1